MGKKKEKWAKGTVRGIETKINIQRGRKYRKREERKERGERHMDSENEKRMRKVE